VRALSPSVTMRRRKTSRNWAGNGAGLVKRQTKMKIVDDSSSFQLSRRTPLTNDDLSDVYVRSARRSGKIC